MCFCYVGVRCFRARSRYRKLEVCAFGGSADDEEEMKVCGETIEIAVGNANRIGSYPTFVWLERKSAGSQSEQAVGGVARLHAGRSTKGVEFPLCSGITSKVDCLPRGQGRPRKMMAVR